MFGMIKHYKWFNIYHTDPYECRTCGCKWESALY